MPKGRKRIAPEIHEANGSFRVHPERRNKDAPKSDGKRPVMPVDFDNHEAKKWEELCSILEGNRVMSSDLIEILVAYCTAYGGWMRAREAVRKTGIVLVQKMADGTTDVKRNPFSVELHKYRDEMNKLLPELGLTPASRSKVSAIDADDNKDDPFASIMERMGRG
jgi:P27 family predicted phage terminase small subunit